MFIGYNCIANTGFFKEACRDWCMMAAPHKDSVSFMTHFNAAEQDGIDCSATAGEMIGNNLNLPTGIDDDDYGQAPSRTDTSISDRLSVPDIISALTQQATRIANAVHKHRKSKTCSSAQTPPPKKTMAAGLAINTLQHQAIDNLPMSQGHTPSEEKKENSLIAGHMVSAIT